MQEKKRIESYLNGENSIDSFNYESINVYRKKDFNAACEALRNDTNTEKLNKLIKHIDNIDFDNQIADIQSWTIREKGTTIGHGPMAQTLQEDSVTYFSSNSFADIPNVSNIENFENILQLSYEKEKRRIEKNQSFTGVVGNMVKGELNVADFLSDKLGLNSNKTDPLEELKIKKNNDFEKLENIKRIQKLELSTEETNDIKIKNEGKSKKLKI